MEKTRSGWRILGYDRAYGGEKAMVAIMDCGHSKEEKQLLLGVCLACFNLLQKDLREKDSIIQAKENENNILRSALKQGMTQEALSFAHDRDKLRAELKAKEDRIKELENNQEALRLCEESMGSKWYQWSGVIISQKEKLSELRTLVVELGRALSKALEIGHECADTAQCHEDSKDVLDWLEHEHKIKEALSKIPQELRESIDK